MKGRYAIDIETKDPNLRSLGDGSIRDDGFITCVGVYGKGEKGEINQCFKVDDPRLNAILRTHDDKIFHNGIYDLSWLKFGYGFTVKGRIEDTMTRESLLYEYADSYKLDDCCKRRGVTGKNFDDSVERWWKEKGGKGEAIKHMDEIPFDVQAEYCLQDCKAAYDLWHKQDTLLTEEGLQEVNTLESDFYPVLMEMKGNGLRIDIEARDRLYEEWNKERQELKERIRNEYGLENINSPKQVREFFGSQGVHSTVFTETGAESFSSDVLDSLNHPAARELGYAKRLDKAVGTFLEGHFGKFICYGRVHPTFVSTKREDTGAITGRMACKNPNVQQIPSKEETFGPQLRTLIIPEEDHTLCAFDYKQIEYVLFIHYAIGPGAEQARQAVRDGADYHVLVQQLMGWDTEESAKMLAMKPEDIRKTVKRLNFGSLYGMGKNKFALNFGSKLRQSADKLNVTLDDYVNGIFAKYNMLVPFVRPTSKGIQKLCLKQGYMRSIGGRKHRTPPEKGIYAMTNYICQGGAADILKAGLVKAYKAGVMDEVIIHAAVHDENLFSTPFTRRGAEAARDFADIMEMATTLKVPIRVDRESGPNWGSVNNTNWREYFGDYSRSIGV
jgi:DNA polymerase-1